MEKTEEKMVRKRRYLTPEAKYQIFLEATMAKAILGKISQASGRRGSWEAKRLGGWDKRKCWDEWMLSYAHRGFAAVVLILVFGLIGWSGFWTIKHFMAEAYCNTVPNSTLNREPRPPVEEIVEAIEWDGSNAEYRYKLAEELTRLRDKSQKMHTEISHRDKEKRDDNFV